MLSFAEAIILSFAAIIQSLVQSLVEATTESEEPNLPPPTQ